MTDFTIEDLRLPCAHGQLVPHIVDPFSTDASTDTWTCPGGRVPTRQELIDMLDIDLEAVAAVEHEQWMKWSQVIAGYVTDHDRVDRWREYWVPYHMLAEDVKEQDRVWARKAVDAALGDGK